MTRIGRFFWRAGAVPVLMMVQSLCAAGVAMAQFKAAEPLVTVAPSYPMSAASERREGWVLLTFVVTTDGTVRDVFVEDSSGLEIFERAALAAVRDFIYEPATIAGRPVEQAWTRFKITFHLHEPTKGASRQFGGQFRRLSRHLRSNDLDQARLQLEHMRARPRINLYEDAWYWWGSALFHAKADDRIEQRKSLLRAVAYEDRMYLPPDIYLRALSMLYADYANSGEYLAAMGMFERLTKMDHEGALVATLQDTARRIAEILESSQPLNISGSISSARPWSHALSRSGFEFHGVVGRIYHLDLRCEQRAEEIAFETQRAFTVPESWGACRLYVHGEAGTTFNFVEFEA